MANGVFISHANMEFRQNMIYGVEMSLGHGALPQRMSHTANPTRVAMEELQLHDLKNMDAFQRRHEYQPPTRSRQIRTRS